MSTARPSPKLKDLLGKTVIVGITRITHKEELIEQKQFVGRFESMDETIHIKLADGTDFTLPPDLRSFQRAKPGVYILRSTGEEVINPDFTSSWTVQAPAPKSKKKK